MRRRCARRPNGPPVGVGLCLAIIVRDSRERARIDAFRLMQLRGGPVEVATAAVGCALFVLISLVLHAREGASRLANFMGGMLAAGLAWAATYVYPHASREVSNSMSA